MISIHRRDETGVCAVDREKVPGYYELLISSPDQVAARVRLCAKCMGQLVEALEQADIEYSHTPLAEILPRRPMGPTLERMR